MTIVQTLLSLILLKSGPQDMPYSARLLNLLVVLYIVSGLIAFQGAIETDIALANMIADVLVIMLYTQVVLRALDRKARFLQTTSAMLGVGIIFHLMAWPLLMQTEIVEGETVISAGASLMMLMLLAWSLLVNAHIFRQALEFSFTSAILLSFALFFLSLAVSRYLLPQA